MARVEKFDIRPGTGRQKANITNLDEPCRFGKDTKMLLRDWIEEFCETYIANKGLAWNTCRAMHIDYAIYLKLKQDNEYFIAKMAEARKSVYNYVESKLFNQIEKENIKAITFYLERRAGYTEKKQVDLRAEEFHLNIGIDEDDEQDTQDLGS